MKTAIVFSFDRLPACCLGFYGAASRTPNLDRFAAGSTVFDAHFIDQFADTEPSCRWSLEPTFSNESASLIRRLNAGGVETHAVVERTRGDNRQPPDDFSATWEIAAAGDSDSPQRHGFAGLVESASDTLSAWSDEPEAAPRLLWIKAEGMPPRQAAYRLPDAAKVAAELDAEFERFLESLHQFQNRADCLVILTANRGLRFAEQREFAANFRLAEEFAGFAQSVVQIPLVIRGNDNAAGTRCRGLTQPLDVAVTLLDWFGLKPESTAFSGASLLPRESALSEFDRDYVLIRGADGHRAVRTAEFLLLARARAWEHPPDDAGISESVVEDVRLFVKPDDVWEVHDVAAQEPEVVGELLARLRADGR